MREILFRGKRIDNGEWVYGFYVKATHHWHKHGVHDDWIIDSAFANGGWFNVMGRHAVDPATVGQYTGLTDTSGKKIFEGDVVVNDFPSMLSNKPHVVEFRNGRFPYVSDYIGEKPRQVRIIGNVSDIRHCKSCESYKDGYCKEHEFVTDDYDGCIYHEMKGGAE